MEGAIKKFFSDGKRKYLKKRLKEYQKAYAYGLSLFQRQEGAPSRDLTLVYLAYAALVSKDPRAPRKTDYGYILEQRGKPINWSHPQKISSYLQTDEGKRCEFVRPFFQGSFLFPFLSPTGFLDLKVINACFAHNVLCVGIPCAVRWSAAGLFKKISPLQFALHDVFYGDYLDKDLPFACEYMDNQPHDCAQARKAIYEDMQKQGLNHFHSSFFWVFHEYGQEAVPSKWLHPNPILQSIAYVQHLYPPSCQSPTDYLIQRICQESTLKGGFYPLNEADFTVDKTDGPYTPTSMDDIVIDESSLPAPKDVKRVIVWFSLKSLQGDKIFVSSPIAPYKDMMQIAHDDFTSIKEYGIQGPLTSITAFSPKEYDAVRRAILENLRAFNDRYKGLFDNPSQKSSQKSLL